MLYTTTFDLEDNKQGPCQMSSKLKLWQSKDSWEEAESSWDEKAREAAQTQPIKSLKTMPSMLGITPETAKNLKWKSFKWMVSRDHGHFVLKGFLHHPIRYGLRYLKSLMRRQSFIRDGDFFLYGI